MVRVLAPLATATVLCIGLVLTSPSVSASSRTATTAHFSPYVFRLRVVNAVSPGTTLWVAHGPINGRFGLVRLHRVAGNLYEGTQRFPANARAEFFFLAGQGVAHTREGAAPGGMVQTIAHEGPLTLTTRQLPLVRWQGPVG